MAWRRILAAIALLGGSHAASADDRSVRDFVGQWRGAEVKVAGTERPPQLEPGDVGLAMAGDDSGFQIRAFGLGRTGEGELARRPIEGRFAPTDTPGVFAFEPEAGSLLSSLFADPEVGNPLEGDTLLWARLEGDALHVYSLAINDSGGFALEHLMGRLEDNGMLMDYELHLENDQMVTVEGRLERAGD